MPAIWAQFFENLTFIKFIYLDGNCEKTRMYPAVSLTVHCKNCAIQATKLTTYCVQLQSLKLPKLIEIKHKLEL